MNSTNVPKRGIISRILPRISIYRELSVQYEGHHEEIPVRVPDISKRGMFINTPHCFPEGSVLNVRFRLTRTDVVVQARGEVRYCLQGVGVGVEFVDISAEAERAIEEEMAVTYGVPRDALSDKE
jgi:hypothetical protein